MAEEAYSVVPRYLRRIEEKTVPMMELPGAFPLSRTDHGARDEMTGPNSDLVRLGHRMDRFDDRLRRTERRLDVTEV